MSKITNRLLAKLAADGDPRVAKKIKQLEKITAAVAQEAQRKAAADRKARDSAVFVIGGALLALIEKNDAAAVAVGRAIAGSATREQDVKRLNDAVARRVIPAILKPRRTLTVASAAASGVSGVAASA